MDYINILINQIRDSSRSLSMEEVRKMDSERVYNIAVEYNNFVSAFNKGKCYICQSPLDTFNKDIICPHWLLRPIGFKKKDFPLLYKNFDFFQIQSLLRWIASRERMFGNINDLVKEKGKDKIIDLTIRYNNLEWSFSCSKSDYKGHKNSYDGDMPHYHFQMRIDNKPFINYNDFHIPFSEPDFITLELEQRYPDEYGYDFPFGDGMNTALTEFKPSYLMKDSISRREGEKATFHIEHTIVLKPEDKITMEDLTNLLHECREKGLSFTNEIHKLNLTVTSTISPAETIPKIAHRTERNRGKKGTKE